MSPKPQALNLHPEEGGASNEQDVGIATRLFEALSEEAPEVKVSVQEALGMCCSAYAVAPLDTKDHLMRLLQTAAAQPAHQVAPLSSLTPDPSTLTSPPF